SFGEHIAVITMIGSTFNKSILLQLSFSIIEKIISLGLEVEANELKTDRIRDKINNDFNINFIYKY
ncbi:hypothetical protein OAM56_05880, partial [Alphaproteobacteria bacterium]|nr:hypothetical protein [Alphaproteobacteria bacterium]